MENQIQKIESNKLMAFSSNENFETAQRIAKMLSSSDLVPKEFKGNIANCVIALNMANRIGADPLMVMQHLYIVHGKPSWSSTFLIAAINGSGKFKAPLRFLLSGEGDNRTCIAWTLDLTGEKLESPSISMQMAKDEGWLQKAGSKWKTMPELMMRYRAAAFFSRLYCPEITMGMQTVEEIQDVEIISSDLIQKPEPKGEYKTKEEVQEDVLRGALTKEQAAELILNFESDGTTKNT